MVERDRGRTGGTRHIHFEFGFRCLSQSAAGFVFVPEPKKGNGSIRHAIFLQNRRLPKIPGAIFDYVPRSLSSSLDPRVIGSCRAARSVPLNSRHWSEGRPFRSRCDRKRCTRNPNTSGQSGVSIYTLLLVPLNTSYWLDYERDLNSPVLYQVIAAKPGQLAVQVILLFVPEESWTQGACARPDRCSNGGHAFQPEFFCLLRSSRSGLSST